MPECACLDTILTAGADVPCVQLRPAAAHKRAQTIGAALEHFGRLCRAHKLQIATVRLALPQAVRDVREARCLLWAPGKVSVPVSFTIIGGRRTHRTRATFSGLSTQRHWWLGRLGLIGAQSCTANCAGGLHCGVGDAKAEGVLS